MDTILSSPLQGFTDYRFRSAHKNHFGGVDRYLAPYIRLDGKGKVKASQKRDILPENNTGALLVPQLMAGNAGDFLAIYYFLRDLGYEEVNWNLGCPYPMVAKRGMGSGLMAFPDRIREIMDTVFSGSDLRISIKMRLGYESPDEIFQVLPLLDDYPLEFICIHPRTGKQLYKGGVDLDRFESCLEHSRHRIAYNGDIHSIQDFRDLKQRFPSIKTWMLGRGLIANPFLPSMIRDDTTIYPENWTGIFYDFHEHLLKAYADTLSGPGHILQRMYHFWEYFINLFPGDKKALKKMKKVKNLEDYRQLVRQLVKPT